MTTEPLLSAETEARFFAPLKLPPRVKRTHKRSPGFEETIKRKMEAAEERGLDLNDLSDKALIRVCLGESRDLAGLTSNRRIQLKRVGLVVGEKGHRAEWTPRGLQLLEAVRMEV